MLKVNVGLSRKLTRDYNSTGFSVNLEGEISVDLNDPEHLIEKIQEYFDLADETLTQQIERYESDSAVGSRDEVRTPVVIESAPVTPSKPKSKSPPSSKPATTPETPPSVGDAATNKQIQYLLNLGKRSGMNTQQVEAHIEQVYGRKIGVYQLTKRQAGELIERLTDIEVVPPNPSRLGRRMTTSA